jgi:hypothetical protein
MDNNDGYVGVRDGYINRNDPVLLRVKTDSFNNCIREYTEEYIVDGWCRNDIWISYFNYLEDDEFYEITHEQLKIELLK